MISEASSTNTLTSKPSKPHAEPTATTERRWLVIVILATVAVTLLPYLVGWSFAQGRRFMWLGYNLDDSCVYLAWMRQAADGAAHGLNLFTTEPQRGTLLNPFFLLLGIVARITRLPLIAVYHLARIGFGAALLLAVWKLIRLTVARAEARKLAFLCVCFGSGLGWLPGLWELSPLQSPIDTWQPEAITFLSLYLNPLFCFSMFLQVTILTLLLVGERTGGMKYAVSAGVCGFALGLTHTYDILSLSAVWVAYLLCSFLSARRSRTRTPSASGMSPSKPQGDTTLSAPLSGSLLRALCAGALTLPAVLYIYRELKAEVIFQQRANVVTASPSPVWLLTGYGAMFALAVYAVWKTTRDLAASRPVSISLPSESMPFETAEPTSATPAAPDTNASDMTTGADAARLLIVWAVANMLASYLPVALFPFQRKMLQGTHFPVAILAGIGLAHLLTVPAMQRKGSPVRLASGGVLLLLGLTNIRFMVRDVINYRDNRAMTQQRPYLNPGEMDALDWLRRNAAPNDAIQPLPWVTRISNDQPDKVSLGVADLSLACFAPSLIHHPVYCGHWGETPDYGGKLNELRKLARPNFPDAQRRELLTAMKVKYLIFSQKNPDTFTLDAASIPFTPWLADTVSVPSYLTLVYSNSDADVYAFTP